MHIVTFSRRAFVAVGAVAVLTLAARPADAQYIQTNLVSDDTTINPALHQDPNLINPWGISESATSPFWVSNNGSGTSTLYNTAGVPQPLVVKIPDQAGAVGFGSVTGQVFNGTGDFKLDATHSPFFIFATENGTISGWNPQADATNAINKVDRAASAVYKGLALANNGTQNLLYAANFAEIAGGIEVFDTNYNPVTLPGGFNDPNAVAGYKPFNIQNLGGELYVTYAKTQTGTIDNQNGDGFGYINVFDTNGNLLRRLATGTDAGGTLTSLNAPWGVAIAPTGFGAFSGSLLVGNFGSGEILALDRLSGALTGILRDQSGAPITIDGLWALQVGNGGNGGRANKVYFTAGPAEETHGIFGSLASAAPEPAVLPLLLCALPLAALLKRRA